MKYQVQASQGPLAIDGIAVEDPTVPADTPELARVTAPADDAVAAVVPEASGD